MSTRVVMVSKTFGAKLFQRTPHEISRRTVWCDKKFRVIFYRKFYRKWTGNDDYHQLQRLIQASFNLYMYCMFGIVFGSWNLCYTVKLILVMVHTDKVAMVTQRDYIFVRESFQMSCQSMRAKFPDKHSAWTALDSPRT